MLTADNASLPSSAPCSCVFLADFCDFLDRRASRRRPNSRSRRATFKIRRHSDVSSHDSRAVPRRHRSDLYFGRNFGRTTPVLPNVARPFSPELVYGRGLASHPHLGRSFRYEQTGFAAVYSQLVLAGSLFRFTSGLHRGDRMEWFCITPHDPGAQTFAGKRFAGLLMGTVAHACHRLFGHGHPSWPVPAPILRGLHSGIDRLAGDHRRAIRQHRKPVAGAVGPCQFYRRSGGVQSRRHHACWRGVLVSRLRCCALDRCNFRCVIIPATPYGHVTAFVSIQPHEWQIHLLPFRVAQTPPTRLRA